MWWGHVAFSFGQGQHRHEHLASARQLRQKNSRKKSQPKRFGPKELKSGYWQEDLDVDDDIDVFEWFNAEELLGDPPAKMTEFREVAKYTIHPECSPESLCTGLPATASQTAACEGAEGAARD